MHVPARWASVEFDSDHDCFGFQHDLAGLLARIVDGQIGPSIIDDSYDVMTALMVRIPIQIQVATLTIHQLLHLQQGLL